MNTESIIAAERNLHADDEPAAFFLAALILPIFIAMGVYMVWRPEEFIRRRRVFTAADKPIMPGGIVWTRLVGCVWLAFTIFLTVSVIVALFS